MANEETVLSDTAPSDTVLSDTVPFNTVRSECVVPVDPMADLQCDSCQ